MTIVISMISFFLDGILSNYYPLFTIVSLVLIYPYFKDDYQYFKYISILGLLYDITYYNTIFYNVCIFIFLGFIIKYLFYYFSINFYISCFISLIVITLFRYVNYLYGLLFIELSFNDFLISVKDSFSINITYCLIIYFISNFFKEKYKIIRK